MRPLEPEAPLKKVEMEFHLKYMEVFIMRIQHNIMAMNSYRNYSSNTSALSKNLEKLSSGYKINRAGDDAAGLAISEKMRAQISGLEQAQSNAKSGINLVQTAEGALTEVHDMLNRMVTLADQSANGTYDNTTDRANLQKEVAQLSSEIDRISQASNFNGIKLLDGSLSNSQTASLSVGATSLTASAGTAYGTGTVQIAAKGANAEGIKVTIAADGTSTSIELGSKTDATYTAEDISTAVQNAAQTLLDAGTATDTDKVKALLSFTLTGDKLSLAANSALDSTAINMAADPAATGGLTLQIGDTSDVYNKLTVSIQNMGTASLGIGGVDISDQSGASDAVELIKTAINTVSSVRGTLGATQNRLDHTINNLSVMTENIQDAESTVRDTDVAKEMMDYTKNNILVQSAQAMLAQANQVPQGVLQLLQ